MAPLAVCVWNIPKHGLRTPNEAFFHQNPELLGLGRQIGPKIWSFWVFSADLSAPILVLWVPCPYFSLINHYFYKKIKPLYPHPKYWIGIWIWIWATKNQWFSHRVTIVGVHHIWFPFRQKIGEIILYKFLQFWTFFLCYKLCVTDKRT